MKGEIVETKQLQLLTNQQILQQRIHKMQHEGKSIKEITLIFASEGITSAFGTPYSENTLKKISAYGSTRTIAKNPRVKKYDFSQPQTTVKPKKDISTLVKAVVNLQGVDRDTKFALIELISNI